jgi:succinate dehydrogenase/fumarate reductase flavoprotein subunit
MDIRDLDGSKGCIEENKALFEEMRSRPVGSKSAHWKEANIALQQIMTDFAGSVRSETLLNAGALALKRLKKKTRESMGASNSHELTRAVETLNLIDLGELVIATAGERKETRGKHIRSDYPFTNPMLAKLLIVKKANGNTITEWREIDR